MAAFSAILLGSLQVGDVFVGKGAKQTQISVEDESLVWLPLVYNRPGATQVKLVFNATPTTINSLCALDDWSINCLADKSEKLFGQRISVEDMRKRFQLTVKTHDTSGMQSWGVKMNTTGKGATQPLDMLRNSLSSPPDGGASEA